MSATTDPNRDRPPWQETLVALRWVLALALVLAAGLFVFVYTHHQTEKAAVALGGAAQSAAERAEGIARGFLSGAITETFLSSLPEIDSSGTGLLEVGRIQVDETFTRSDERRVLWDTFSLGTTTTEIRVPVTYRYHLRLDDAWRLEVSDRVCIVYPPRIRPTQPPAIHTEGLRKRVDEALLRFDAAEQLATLEQSMTPRLRQMAGDPRHVDLIRETARRTVAEFVRGWLLRENQWGEGRFHTIEVHFPDEGIETVPPRGPTLRLGEGASGALVPMENERIQE